MGQAEKLRGNSQSSVQRHSHQPLPRVWPLRPGDPSKRLAERQPAGWRA